MNSRSDVHKNTKHHHASQPFKNPEKVSRWHSNLTPDPDKI
jgi:hypothetical protein